MKIGDRVTRKKINAFRYSVGNGTVVSIEEDKRIKVRWDKKASNGQQHSTIQEKFLIKLTTLSCMSCGVQWEGEEPKMCCSGRDCGCMGLPIDPVLCGEKECNDKFFKKKQPIAIIKIDGIEIGRMVSVKIESQIKEGPSWEDMDDAIRQTN